MNQHTLQGIAAAKSGRKDLARQFLGTAVQMDERDIAAWWWLARVIDDPKASHKCLEKARAAAAEGEEGSRIYQGLLRESGAPSLPRYRLAEKSKSVGDQCPICSANMAVGDEVIVCPTCHRANHRECWEENLFHCGNFACEASGLVERGGAVQVEAKAAAAGTVRVEQSEIPKETPWASRETQEAGFMNRLGQMAHEALVANVVRQMAIAGMRERARQQHLDELRREVARRTNRGFFAGLVAGALLAVPVFQYSRSWVVALVSAYLTALFSSTVAAQRFLAEDRLTSVLYYVLPQVFGAAILGTVFVRSGNGAVASAAAVFTMFVSKYVLQIPAIYARRAFVAYSFWALGALALLKLVLMYL